MNGGANKRPGLWRRLSAWLDARLPGPTSTEMRSRGVQWDYDQVDDASLWNIEIDPDHLATTLRQAVGDDPQTAFNELLDLALTGSAIAMNGVGECYSLGRGAAESDAKAEPWFRRAFDAGSQRALLNYGKTLMWRGEPGKAEEVFQRGADDDWTPAIYWLADVLLRKARDRATRDRARSLLERAAAEGSPAADWRLIRDGMRGRFGWRWRLRGLLRGARSASSWLEWYETTRKSGRRHTHAGETIH